MKLGQTIFFWIVEKLLFHNAYFLTLDLNYQYLNSCETHTIIYDTKLKLSSAYLWAVRIETNIVMLNNMIFIDGMIIKCMTTKYYIVSSLVPIKYIIFNNRGSWFDRIHMHIYQYK